MKKVHILTLAALMGLSSLALATDLPAAAQRPAQAVAGTTCRNVSDLAGKVQPMCGTREQWARFDSQIVKLDRGFSCRRVKDSPQELCLFAKQWDYVNRTNAPQRGGIPSDGFGVEVGKMLAMSIDSLGYSAVR